MANNYGVISALKAYVRYYAAALLHATRHTNGADDIQSATAGQKGLMTATYAGKVDGIEANADVSRGSHTQEIMCSTDLVTGAPGNTFLYRWCADAPITIDFIRVYFQTLGASAAGTYTIAATGNGNNLLDAATHSLEDDEIDAATLHALGLTATAADLALASGALVLVTVASSNADLVGQTGGYFQIGYHVT
jgi:UDP-N-acetylglucosamine enolpyruvyl transferase